MNSRRQSTLLTQTFISFPGTTASTLRNLFRSPTAKSGARFPTAPVMVFSFLTCFLYIIPYVGRAVYYFFRQRFPVMKEQFAIPPADGCPSSDCGVGCSAPYLTNFVKSGTSRLYSAGALNCTYPGKTTHRPLTSLYQPLYFPIRIWECGTTPIVKPLK